MTWDELGPVLQAIGLAEAAGEELDLTELVRNLDASENEIHRRVESIEAYGLAYSGWGEVGEPGLRNPGRQYLSLKGGVDAETLRFLPMHIDDLNTRRALLKGGIVLVDEFRHAINKGAGREFSREMSPSAFEPLIDDGVALDLFAAAVALMARLSGGKPAGCVAEEIVAISLMGQAEAWLEMEHGEGKIDADGLAAARAHLQGLFGLFQDVTVQVGAARPS